MVKNGTAKLTGLRRGVISLKRLILYSAGLVESCYLKKRL